MQKAITLHNIDNYNILQETECHKEKMLYKEKNLKRQSKVATEGPRRTVNIVLIANKHNFPYLIMFKIGNSSYELPNGKVKSTESTREAVMRILESKYITKDNESDSVEVFELLAKFYREDFVTNNVIYPYIQPHVDEPNESIDVFLVKLPSSLTFRVPKYQELIAVPLFEVYDNAFRYGPIISAIPQLFSKFKIYFGYN